MSTLGQGIENIQRVEFETPDLYHKIDPPRVSNSILKAFAEDPEDCWESNLAPAEFRVHREPTPSMIWGTNLETLFFYDRLPGVVIPNDVMRTQQREGKTIYVRAGDKWESWKAAQIETHGPDVQLLRQDEWDKQIAPLLIARDKARSHDAAAKLLWGEGEPHVTYTWDDVSTGVRIPCKAQLDRLSKRGIIIDLKSAQQAALGSRIALAGHLLKFKYHWQAWWYKHCVLAATGKNMPFVFVFVGNKRPHSVQVVEMTDDWLDLAENQVRTHFGQLAQAWQSGVWKAPGWGEVQRLVPPRWAANWEEDSWLFAQE